MTTPLLPVPIFRAFDSAGLPLAGGLLYTYAANTLTPKATYSSNDFSTPNTNPVVLDTTGSAIVRLIGSDAYKFVLKDALGTTQWTIDYYQSSYLTQADIGLLLYPQTAAEIAAGVTPTLYYFPPLNPWRYGADGTGGAADTTAFAAVNSVIAQISGLNWFKNDLRSLPNDVRRYGAVGDGTTDDSAAFTSALTAWTGKAIYVPNPPTSYKFTAGGVTVPTDTAVIGESKRSCKFLAGANINMFTLNAGAQLYRIYIEGNATTGKGVVIPSALGNQTIQNCRILNFDVGTGGGTLHFNDNSAGSRISVHDLEIEQTNGSSGSDKYAIYMPDVFSSTAVPRKFSHIETGGKAAFFFGGCNDVFIAGSFLGDCKFSSNSRAVQITATRIANQTQLTIDGANHSIGMQDINPQIVLPSTLTNSVIGPASLNRGLATNNTITAITQANPAVVTISTGGASNPFLVGQTLHVDSVVGMTQINDVESVVTAIGGSTGAWTITLTVDSSAFTAYASGGFLTLPTIIDNTAGNNYNQIFQGRQIYNPTISNSGANFVLGNGTCLGYYAQAGSLITVWINFTLGSTTTIGTTELRFRLPKPKPDGEVLVQGSGVMTVGAQQYTVVPQIPGNLSYARLIWSRNDGANSGIVSGTSPGALAAGDIIRLFLAFER